jgi:hypothetical protein
MTGSDRGTKLTKRVALAIVAATTALLVIPSGASAAVTVGQTFTPTLNCVDRTRLQTTSPGSQYIVPSTGGITAWTVTAWSFQSDATPPLMSLRVGRPATGANNYTIIGASATVTPPANTLTTFATQIPVKAGDIIGSRTPGSTTQNCARTLAAGSGYQQSYVTGELGVGGTATFTTQNDVQQDISAVLTPVNTFTLGTVKRNKKKGTATLTINVPNAGQLALSGNGIKSASAVATGAGDVKLKIKATGKKRTKLNDTGKVKVTPKVAFTPTGGDKNTASRKLTLKKN